MTENIQDLIDRLSELDKKASPAPWKLTKTIFRDEEITYDVVSADKREILVEAYGESSSSQEEVDDVLMLVNARNAVPALIAEIERLREELSKDLIKEEEN